MKKTVSLLLILALLACLPPAWAAGPAGSVTVRFYDEESGQYQRDIQTDVVRLTLDGSALDGPVPAMVQYVDGDGRTLVPVRLVSEHLGAQVIWVAGTRQVILLKGADTIVLTLGSSKAVSNGQIVDLPGGVAAGVVKYQGVENTMVPLRFVSEQLGAQIQWDQDTFTAAITAPREIVPEPEPEPSPVPEPSPLPDVSPSPGDLGLVTKITADANAQTVDILTDHTPEYRVLDLGDRVVVDVLGSVLASGFPGTITVENDLITTVRYAQHSEDDLSYGYPHTVRVVLDLRHGVTLSHNVKVEALASGIRITTYLPDEDRDEIDFTPSIPIDPHKSTIVLDAGHGGSRDGATYEGYKEKDINLSVTRKVQALLLAQGYNVVMTRSDDSYMDLYDRADIANAVDADIFVSIHSNASATNKDFQGIFTYYHPSSNRGARLAQAIQMPLAQITGGIDRGILSNDYVVLRETDMCAALVEMGFMSNHEELMRLIDDSYQDKLAQGIAEGIVRYLNSLS